MIGMDETAHTSSPEAPEFDQRGTVEPGAQPAAEPGRRAGMSSRQWWSLVVIVPVVLIGAFLAARALGGDDGPTVGMRITDATDIDDAGDVDWFYRIPPGTAQRIAAGEIVEIVPSELVVELNDTIRIVNDDSSAHVVGVFFVGAGETVTQRFQSVGVLEGECSVHPSGSFSLRVVDA
jgi:hypothetical protein